MKISIICVGKIKEKFYIDALNEYLKRLSRYCKTEVLEVADEKTPDKASPLEVEQILKEGDRLISRMKDDAFVISLEILGDKMNSTAFADVIQRAAITGKSHIQFVIGGSLGLHKDISKRANLKISFSDMTFPHQLMRVILCEQIYRGYRIIHNEPYHK